MQTARVLALTAWLAALMALPGGASAADRMSTLDFPSTCPAGTGPSTLVVFLPGRGMDIREFAVHDGVAALRGNDVDVDLVDAHRGYYADRTILRRLHDEVVAPARARGVRDVWLVGISMGAYGAMLYAATHPDEITGVVALGPYFGGDTTQQAIRAAGGLKAWRPDVAVADLPLEGRGDILVWQWLQDQARAGARRTWIGHGDDDRFLAADLLATAAFPRDRVVVRPGGHDWGAWQPAWQAIAAQLPLPACAPVVPAPAAPKG